MGSISGSPQFTIWIQGNLKEIFRAFEVPLEFGDAILALGMAPK